VLTVGGSAETKISTADIGVATFAMSDDNSCLCYVDLNGRANFLKTDETFSSYTEEEGVGGLVSNDVIRKMSCKIGSSVCGGMPTFAVPSKDGVCALYSRNSANGSWQQVDAMECEAAAATHFGKSLNLASFSPSGQYLATADVEGVVVVWKVVVAAAAAGSGSGSGNSSKMIESVEALQQYSNGADKEALVDLVWTSEHSLLACSKSGFAVMADVVPASATVAAAASSVEEASAPTAAATAEQPAAAVDADALNDSQGDMDVEAIAVADESIAQALLAQSSGAPATESGAAVEKPRRRLEKNAAAKQSADSDDEDGLFEDTVATASTSSSKNNHAAADSQLSQDGAVNMESISDIKSRVVLDEDEQAALGMSQDADIAAEWRTGGPDLSAMSDRIKELENAKKDTFKTIQEPFQPSSTANDSKERRLMVWNDVGYIRLDEDVDSQENRIEVNFTNMGGRNKSFAFGDKLGFRIASLSNEGAFFATDIEEVDEDDANYKTPGGSKLFYHAFPGHLNGANESFYLDLQEGEKALCVTVGAGWAAVATSKGLLRVFSSTGVQLHVYWLKGPIVTLVGSGSQLAVFYSAGQPVDGTSRINVELYSLFFDAPDQNRCVLADHAVPVSKKGNMVWAGFEKEHKTLVMLDSEGMMSMLLKPLGWQWMPIYDVHEHRKSPDMHYWPIMVSGTNFTFILLNGETMPTVWPHPAATTRELRVPVANYGKGREFKVWDEHSHSLLYAQAISAHAEKVKTDCIVSGERNHDEAMDEEALEAVQMQADKMVLIMLQTSLKAGQTAKAADLSHKLRTDKGLAAGIQLANKFGKVEIARLLEDIQDYRAQEERLQEQEEQPAAMAPSTYAESDRMEYMAGGGTPQAAARQQQEQEGQEEGGNVPYYANTYDDEPFQGNSSATDGYANDNGVAEPSAPEEGGENNGGNNSSQQRASAVTPGEGAAGGPLNPFARNASPVKRKANYGIDGVVKDFKTSPSPVKKPLLSRQSSFSESARKSQKTRQALL
jgi:hypothetical protein